MPIKTLIDINIIIYRMNIQISGTNLFCRSLLYPNITWDVGEKFSRSHFWDVKRYIKNPFCIQLIRPLLARKYRRWYFHECIYSSFSARNEFSVLDEFKLVARCRGILLSRKHPWIHERSPLHFIITFLANGIRWIMSCKPRLGAEIA